MNIQDLVFRPDFMNLVKGDLDQIINDIEFEVIEAQDEYDSLYEIRSTLYKNESAKTIVLNRAFAGRTSVKWYRINMDSDADKNRIKECLESELNYYNDILEIDANSLSSPRRYTCFKVSEGRYLLRVLVPQGVKTVNSGRNLNKYTIVNNVVVFVNLNHAYIEVRANYRDAKKVVNAITGPLSIAGVREIRILENYNNSIEVFKNDLIDGKFTDVTSVPIDNHELSREQSEILVNVLQYIDDYFITRDMNKLTEELNNTDLGDLNLPFTQLFLAGMAKIGLEVRPDVQEDLSGQSLYNLFKTYMSNERGYISFATQSEGTLYTIQVGVTTDSINFKTSVTEEVIDYIRNKVLGL